MWFVCSPVRSAMAGATYIFVFQSFKRCFHECPCHFKFSLLDHNFRSLLEEVSLYPMGTLYLSAGVGNPVPGEPQGVLLFVFALRSATNSDPRNQVRWINCVIICFNWSINYWVTTKASAPCGSPGPGLPTPALAQSLVAATLAEEHLNSHEDEEDIDLMFPLCHVLLMLSGHMVMMNERGLNQRCFPWITVPVRMPFCPQCIWHLCG